MGKLDNNIRSMASICIRHLRASSKTTILTGLGRNTADRASLQLLYYLILILRLMHAFLSRFCPVVGYARSFLYVYHFSQ